MWTAKLMCLLTPQSGHGQVRYWFRCAAAGWRSKLTAGVLTHKYWLRFAGHILPTLVLLDVMCRVANFELVVGLYVYPVFRIGKTGCVLVIY